jgi:xyloglucan-specific exo-beta-1,4-glucanase
VRRIQRRIAGPARLAIEALENRLLLSTAAYTWQNAAIGAGGFLDGVFFDPNNNGVMYARTDIGGLYKSTNSGNNWQQLLNFVGNTSSTSGNSTGEGEFQVLSFAIDPENSNNLYALVGPNGVSGNNGNILRSTNAGLTWNVSSPTGLSVNGNGTARGTGERIAVDPNDSNIIFAGSNGSTGLWESTNAGVTFTKITTTGFPADDVDFVEFDPYGGTVGSPSQTIFVGATAHTTGSNIYKSTNGGTSWTEVSNTGGPASFYPTRAAFDSTNDGDVYFAFGNQLPPEGTVATSGGVWRYNVNTSTWGNITPAITSGTSTSSFVGLGVDAENPGTVVVTTFDHYSSGDLIFRTTNANATTPTWVSLYGGTSTRNTTLSPYLQPFTDGIGNWAATAAIDPFSPGHIVFGTGQGLWTTLTGNSSTTLTAANSWYFLDSGIEFTSVLKLAAPASGIPLLSAIGDVNGFAATTLTSSPAAGAIAATISGGGISTMNSIDFAQSNPNIEAIVGGISAHGAYSTNDGATWTAFATSPGSSGSIAVSADGTTFLWAPSGATPSFSTNDGATWTASTMPAGTATGGTVVSDRINASQLYYWTENSSDNSWQLYISTNGGQTFTADGAAQGDGNITLVADPFTAGDLWFSSYNGIYHSTNSGGNFSQLSSLGFTNVPSMALGAPAPGRTNPAIYMYGLLSGFQGVYRSDDGGSTWVQLNTTSQQWGGLINTMAADPNVFGRVYIGVNGSGIVMGNPASSLPANWIDADINSPGNPGWATSSTTLSTGTVVNQWNIDGGGAGLAGTLVSISSLSVTGNVATAISTTTNGFQAGQMVTISGASNLVYDGTFVITSVGNTTAGIASNIGGATLFTFALVTANGTASGTIKAASADQFNYAYEPINGSASISAQLLGLTNADNGNGTPQAGVMFRAGTNANDPFFELAQTSASSLLLEYRTTAGGAVTTVSQSGILVGSEFVEVIRSGNNFSGFFSSSGTSWTQIGSTVAIAAIPSTANVGLAASASYNPQLTAATFANVVVNAGPSVVTPAAANPNPVTDTSTALSVLGADSGGEASLTYTWSAAGPAAVTYTGNGNGTHAASAITANFTQAGSYNFTVTITDAGSLSTTSSVAVTVNQTLTNITVTPSSVTIAGGTSGSFTATGFDQFGVALASQPTFTWGTTGGGTVAAGLFSASQIGGSYTVTAAVGSISAMATVNVVPTVYSTSGVYYVVVSSGMENIWVGSAGVGNPTYSIGAGQLPSLAFNGDTADDSLTIDYSGGDPIPSGGLAFNGGSGDNTLTIIGTAAADTIAVNPTNTTFNSDVPITYSDLQSLVINGGAGADVITQAAANVALTISPTAADTLNVSVGTFSISASAPGNGFNVYPVAALNVAGGAVVSLQSPDAPADRTVLVLGSLSVAATGQLDVGTNDLIVHGGDLPTLTEYIGQELVPAAASNTTLAVVLNIDNDGNRLISTFDNQSVQSTDVLIKYTYFGDADLSGDVTATDYMIIDNGLNFGLTGWQNGDFNYDNKINGDDYTLIDNAFNTQSQSGPLAAVKPLAEVAEASTPLPPRSLAAPVVSSSADSDDTLLKRRHHSLVQEIEQLKD